MAGYPDKPRVLMFAPSCFPPGDPEAFVNIKLALVMRNAGWKLDIFTNPVKRWLRYPKDHLTWESLRPCMHLVPEYPDNLPTNLWTTAVGILRFCQIRSVRWVLRVLGPALALAKRKSYDVILSRALPVTSHMAALEISRKTGIPCIANWNDPSPGYRFPVPYVSQVRPVRYLDRRFLRAVCDGCAWHTFPCERLREYMSSYFPDSLRAKSSVIPHIAMPQFSAPGVRPEGFSICHAGSILPPRDAGPLLEGARRFLQKRGHPKPFAIRFLGDDPAPVVAKAKEVGIESVVQIEPSRPYSEMPQVLASASVLAIVEAPVAEGIFLPSKLIDYVQVGRPILAVSPAPGAVRDILSQHGGGIAADVRSPDEVAAAIETLYDHWRCGTLEQTYGSSRLMGLFDERRVLSLYVELLERLTGKRFAV